MEEGRERALRRLARDAAPDRGAAIGVLGERTEGVAGLEGEVFLDGVDGGEVIVLDLAELEKAVKECG